MKEFLKKYRRYNALFSTIAIVSGMGLLIWFGILPFQRFITEKADSIQEYYVTRDNRLEQMGKLPELQGQFEYIEAEEKVMAILLTEDRVVDFVQTLEKLGRESNVHIEIRSKTGDIIEEKVKPKVLPKKPATTPAKDAEAEPEKKTKGPLTILESVPFDRYLHVEVVVKGDYQTIVGFLHKMETLPLALDVIGMAFRVRDEDEIGVTGSSAVARNPFLLLDNGETTTNESELPREEVIPGMLEASFDTLVYLEK